MNSDKELVSGPGEDLDLGKPMGEYESTRKPGHCPFLPESDNRLQKDHWEGGAGGADQPLGPERHTQVSLREKGPGPEGGE